ncbi:T9SS type A sorting domain-containing protein [Polluticoccus soli]|uniref:T9SS type A sorting domain-containing protein n=1 Tax=Polluticoccus soli TaxID=3034150 RepID=UPI0023E31091|nr:T9SS type A sorting domain-containing protein [Flavipsychrobacter sp. JY13-12]
MKLPVLFVPLMTLALGVQAQQAYKYNAPGKHYSPYVRHALTKQLTTAHKTTAAHERISGYSVYVFDGSSMNIQDSSNFKYSNARGFQFNPNSMFLDDETIQFDSATYFVDFGSGFQLDHILKSTYDNANKRLTRTELRPDFTPQPENFRDRRAFYDANGNLSIEYVLGWNNSTNAWDTLTRKHYGYNGQNQLIADSIYVYSSADFMNRTEYSLDGNGNQVEIALFQRQSGSWIPQYLEKHTYDALNNLTTNYGQQYDQTTSSWVDNSFDTFAYNNHHVYHFTENWFWNTTTSSWEYTTRELRTLNAAGDRVMIQDMKQWDAQTSTWEDNAVIEWAYTAMGHPSNGVISIDFGGTPFEVGNVNVFYEQYNDLHIGDTKEKTSTLSLYPNPATNIINLEWAQPLHDAKISLTNMMGQQVYQTNQPVNGSSMSVQIDQLPAGTYLLSVHNNTGIVLETKTVVKQ